MTERPPSRMYTAQSLDDAELHEIGPGLAAVLTLAAPDGDGANQDGCALLPVTRKSGALALADGAGGLPGGARAAALALQAVKHAVRKLDQGGGDLRTAVMDGFDRANHDVQALGIGAGTTLAVLEIDGNTVRPYHVGDSQIIVVGSGGKLKLCTMSHSPTGYAVGAGLLEERDALLHEERHMVSNLVGTTSMHIEVGPRVELLPKDTVLLASDGLFDNLHIPEIVEACRKGQLLAMVRGLAELCHQRMTAAGGETPSKPDDLTIIAYRRRVTD